jgi:hypothetical protein
MAAPWRCDLQTPRRGAHHGHRDWAWVYECYAEIGDTPLFEALDAKEGPVARPEAGGAVGLAQGGAPGARQ